MQAKTKKFRTQKVQIDHKNKMKSWSSFRLTNKNVNKAHNKSAKTKKARKARKARKASKKTRKVRHIN